MTELDTLLFPDRRIDGAFPVTDAHGNPIARVTAAWTGGRASMTTPCTSRRRVHCAPPR
jgi:hypothetical protein